MIAFLVSLLAAAPLPGQPAPAHPSLAPPPASTPRPAAGVPTLTIQGTARLELERMEPTPRGVLVTVRLVDDDLGDPVADRQVTVSVRQGPTELLRRTAKTNSTGRAQVLIPHRAGHYQLALEFPGDRLYSVAAPEVSEVDLSKGAVQLSLEAPPRLVLGGRTASLLLTAHHGDPVPSLAVRLRVRRGAKTLVSLRGITDDAGQWRTSLAPDRLGAPGELTLEAFSSPTRRYNSAHARQRIYLVSRTRVTFSLAKREVRLGATVRASGVVRDALGPLQGAQVHVGTRGRRLATTRCDAEGRFRIALPSRSLGTGAFALRARFVPRTAWHLASESKPSPLRVTPPKPIPASYFLLPAAFTALLLLVLWGVRARVWRHLRRPARQAEQRQEAPSAGIELGKRTGRYRRSGRFSRRLTGHVLDLREATPIPTATLYLRPLGQADAAPLSSTTDPDGAFALPDVPAGTFRLVVTAPGWVPQSADVQVPHRGELEGMTIRLLSVRQEVMRVYTEVVSPLLPGSDRVLFWTPAETVAHLHATRPRVSTAVSPLADLAAEVRYGPVPPGEDALEEAVTLATHARAGVAESDQGSDAASPGDERSRP